MILKFILCIFVSVATGSKEFRNLQMSLLLIHGNRRRDLFLRIVCIDHEVMLIKIKLLIKLCNMIMNYFLRNNWKTHFLLSMFVHISAGTNSNNNRYFGIDARIFMVNK